MLSTKRPACGYQGLLSSVLALERTLHGGASPPSSIPLWEVHRRRYYDEAWENSDNVNERPATPWVRTVQSGIELLRNPKYNKGMAFTKSERDRHYLHGLLPPAYMNQDLQVVRVMANLREYTSDIQKYNHLMALQERNERLFYRVLLDHIEELLPVVYTPTVGIVCQQYGLMFRRPRGLFISIRDKGRVMELLKNWPEKRVRAIVVTDGERVLGLGDLGVQGMGIPVGKLSLYTAIGGLHPSECLPVTLDVGTNNKALLAHPFYPGLRQTRVDGEEYDDLVDEFMEACTARFGNKTLIQFEDMSNRNAFRLLLQYRGSHLVFNDDIQGTGAVALAGVLASLPLTGGKLSDQTFLFNGAGEAGTTVAEMIALQISKEKKISIPDAREKIWLVDSKGLVVKSRMETLENHKLPFAKDFPETADLLDCVKAVRPSALIGVSGRAFSFTKEMCEAMIDFNERPIIFPLSTPSTRAECTAEQAYTWTKGRCIFASGSPFPAVQVNGQWFQPGQVSSAYIFPSVGLGCIVSGSTRVRDEMFLVAAEALASQVTTEDRNTGLVYPRLWRARSISAIIAKAVASKAYDLGLATNLPKPPDLLERIQSRMWDPHYRRYR